MGVSAYLDDILVHTKTEEEHLSALKKVLEAHADAGIKLKAKKTTLFEREVEFLGHRVSNQGISPSARHLEMIANLEEPKNGKEVQSMIGFIQVSGAGGNSLVRHPVP